MSTDSRPPRVPGTPAFVQALGLAFAVVATVAMLGGTELIATQRTVSSHAQIVQLPRVTVTKQRIAGEPQLNEELADARWVQLSELSGYKTTDGLAPIVAAAFDVLKAAD